MGSADAPRSSRSVVPLCPPCDDSPGSSALIDHVGKHVCFSVGTRRHTLNGGSCLENSHRSSTRRLQLRANTVDWHSCGPELTLRLLLSRVAASRRRVGMVKVDPRRPIMRYCLRSVMSSGVAHQEALGGCSHAFLDIRLRSRFPSFVNCASSSPGPRIFDRGNVEDEEPHAQGGCL